MATQSTIEWTEQTWNPTTGCTKVSPGCKNCYAEVMARRLHAMGAPGYENEFKLTVHENRLEQPLLRKKPTTYFVNSMSDLFHEAVSDKFLDRVFSIIETTPHHTYQILTKRAERLPEYFARRACPQNVWLYRHSILESGKNTGNQRTRTPFIKEGRIHVLFGD